MLKKLAASLAITSLTACITDYHYPLYEARFEPTIEPIFELNLKPNRPTNSPANNKDYYKIATHHINHFIQAKNNLEYCLLPELGQHSDPRLTALEKHLMKEMIDEQLEKIVGKASANAIYDDPQAYRYFRLKYRQLKHELTNIRQSECRDLKDRYSQRFKANKRQRGLEPYTGNSIERHIQERRESIEEKIQRQRESIERKIQDRRESIERKISGKDAPLYQRKKDAIIDWSHPLDRW